MAEDAIAETEVTTEPVAAEPETTDTPADAETVVDTSAEDAAPESEGEAPDDVATEPVAESALSVEALRGMSQSERMTWMRENAPEVANDLEYAGGQRKEAELRRESGSREETAARLKAIRDKLMADPEADVAELNFLDDNNVANATERVMRALAEGAVAQFNPSDEERATYEAAIVNLNGDGLRQYAMQMVSLAADRVGSKRILDMDVSDLPPDSNLAKSVKAQNQAGAQSEAKAAELEAKPSGNAPPTTAGQPAGSNESFNLDDPLDVARAFRAGKFDEAEGNRLLQKAWSNS